MDPSQRIKLAAGVPGSGKQGVEKGFFYRKVLDEKKQKLSQSNGAFRRRIFGEPAFFPRRRKGRAGCAVRELPRYYVSKL
jgi:hypothetical protein